MKKFSVLLVAITVLCFLGGNAWAMLVNTQFNSSGTYSGAAIIGTAGDSWNHVGAAGTAVSLLDSAGASSGVSLTWSSSTLVNTNTGFSSTAYANLMLGYITATSTSKNISYSGLTPNGGYDLFIYTQGDNACTGRKLTVSLNGGAPVTTTAAVATASTFIQGQNYLQVSGTADSSGHLVIAYSTGNLEANINGLQLVATPQSNIETTTTVASSNNPSAFGDSTTFTASVTPAGLGGTVIFYDNATSIGTSALVGGTAIYLTSSLSVGSHSITATYTPAVSSYNSSSTLSALTQIVNTIPVVNSQAATSITLSSAMLHSDVNPNNMTLDLLYRYGIDPSLDDVSTLAGSTAGAANGTGMAAQFNSPYGVAVDSTGNVYVADTSNNLIRKITPDGVVSTLAGSGTAGFADGTGTAAKFSSPTGVAVDSTGNVYVADFSNNRIRKITAGGVVTTFAGSGTGGTADGTGITAQFDSPHGVAVDIAGTIYVVDFMFDRIRKITAGGVVTTLAGSTTGYVNGTGTAAQFNYPHGVAVDNTGTVLYVADTNNHRIRKITTGGVVSTFAGSGIAGTADGAGTAAQFSSPYGVAVDSSGTVYVAETSNNRIRKITSAGVVSTLTGSTAGYTDGIMAVAKLSAPKGVTVDSSGNFYVADTSNNRIRKIVTSNQSIPAQSGLTGSTVINNSLPLTGLVPQTTYYYRAVADYGSGMVFGNILNFTTLPRAISIITTWPTAGAITYGQTLASVTLSGGVSTPVGSFAFTTPATIPSVGIATHGVTFTPTDSSNYTTEIGTASVTVNMANQSIGAINAVPASVNVGGSTTVSATATPSGLPVTFSSLTSTICTVNGTIVTGVKAGVCTIAADQSGDGNYNAATQVTKNISIMGTYTSTSSGGLWSAASTWEGGELPPPSSHIVIAAGGSVTLDGNQAITNLTVNSGGTLDVSGFDFSVGGATSVSGVLAHTSNIGAKTFIGLVTINSGGVWSNDSNAAITFQGGITNNGSFASGTAPQTVTGPVGGTSATTIDSLTVSGALTNNITSASGLTVATTLTAGTSPSIIQGTNAILTLTAAPPTGITWTASTSGNTIIYNGAAQSLRALSFNILTISGTGTTTMSGSTTVNATLTINSGAELNTNNSSLTLRGSFINNGTFNADGSPVTISGAAIQSISGFTTTGTVTMYKTGGTATFLGNVNGGAFTVHVLSKGTIYLGAGLTHTFSGNFSWVPEQWINTLDCNSSTLNIGGSFSFMTGNVFTAGTGTVNFFGAAQTIPRLAYNNLTLSGSGIKTTTGVTVNGILSMEGTATASVAPTYGAAATLKYNTASAKAAGPEWITPFAATGGVFIANTGEITLNASKTFNASRLLTINSGATLNTSAASNWGLTFGGNFVNNGTFIANASTITISSTAMNNGAFTASVLSGTGTLTNGANATLNYSGTGAISPTLVATASGNTVNYTAGGNQTVKATSYNNLILSGGGAKTMNTGTLVNGNLSIAPTGTAKASIANGVNLGPIKSLTLGGFGRVSGSWGGTASATNIETTYFASTTGILNVTTDTRIAGSITALPTASDIMYGNTLTASTLTGGSGSPAGGTFNWTTPTTAPAAGTTSQSVTYSPTELTSYKTVTGNANITVTPKSLAVTGITASNKEYDATTTATLITAAATLVGAINGDDVVLVTTGATGSFADAAVGIGKTVTISGLSLSGAAAGNYTLVQPTATADITLPRPQVTSQAATSVSFTGAWLNASVNPKNKSVDLYYYYGTTSNLALQGVSTLAGSSEGSANGYGAAAQFTSPENVAVDSSGNVYVADTNNHLIRKVTPTGKVSLLAGSIEGFDEGTGSDAKFKYPYGIAVDSSGTVYVADAGNNRIRKITPGGLVSTLAGSSDGGSADGAGAEATFFNPFGVAVDNAGTVYVADYGNHLIRTITPGGMVSTLAGSTSGFEEGTGAAAKFKLPMAIAVDNAGTVYVADSGNYRVRTVTPAGLVNTLAGSTVGFSDGPGATALFSVLRGLAVDGAGVVYLADYGNNRIRTITPGGEVTTLSGSALGFADGTLAEAKFNYPAGVALGSNGAVYVADSANNRIRMIMPSSTAQEILAQSGITGDAVVESSQQLTGLQPQTTYYFRPAATYSEGKVYGEMLSFTTGTPQSLIVSGITAVSRDYDGTSNAALNTSGATLVGVINSDDVTLVTTGATGAFATADVGTGKTVTISGLSLAGTAAANYTLIQPTLAADISKATPVITWATPADILQGTALSATQLNAASGGIAGNFVYTPPLGTVLDEGNGNLSATFTPTDTTNYNAVIATVGITVTASTRTLAVTISGNGSVNSITPEAPFSCASGSCSASFASGTTLVISASAATSSQFVAWSGACTGTGDCSLTLNANKDVTATFTTTPLVKIGSNFYGTLADAYAAILEGETMEITSIYFAEDLTLNRNVKLVLAGGKSADYSGVTGMTSVRSLTIALGEVTVNGLIIE